MKHYYTSCKEEIVMKKTMKRLLALGMTLSIAVGMFPVTAMAAGNMPDSYDFRGKTSVDETV